MRRALEEDETPFGNLGDDQGLVAQHGFLAVVGDLGAGAELHLLEVGERAVFLGVKDLRGEDARGLVGYFDAERKGSLLLCR